MSVCAGVEEASRVEDAPAPTVPVLACTRKAREHGRAIPRRRPAIPSTIFAPSMVIKRPNVVGARNGEVEAAAVHTGANTERLGARKRTADARPPGRLDLA